MNTPAKPALPEPCFHIEWDEAGFGRVLDLPTATSVPGWGERGINAAIDAAVDEVAAERDALKQTLHDELDSNLRLRELGGARPDEPMTPFLERVFRERDAAVVAVAEAQRELGECTGGYQTLEREVADLKRQLAEARGVPDWRPAAATWLRLKAAEQAVTNAKYPAHAESYPSWRKYVRDLERLADELEEAATAPSPTEPAMPAERPIDMILYCPNCGMQHIDAPEFNGTMEDKFPAFGEDPAMSWTNPPHRSHLCHGCGHIWRPADVATNGVAAIKTRGKNDSPMGACAHPVAHPAPVERVALSDEQIDCLRGLDTDRRVRFYEHDFYVLSNFSAFSIVWDGRRFDTSEHLYHYLKFNTTAHDVADAIFGARSAHEAYKIAERNKALRRPDWDEVKVGLMSEILRLKVKQHEYVRRKLLATGDRELVEDSWRDDFWGWGPNRDGRNMLGKLWMEVRAELRGITPAQGKEKQG